MVLLFTRFRGLLLTGAGKGFNDTVASSREIGAWSNRLTRAQMFTHSTGHPIIGFGVNLLPFPGNYCHFLIYRNLMKLAATLRPTACHGLLVMSAWDQGLQAQNMHTKLILQVKATYRDTSQQERCRSAFMWSTSMSHLYLHAVFVSFRF